MQVNQALGPPPTNHMTGSQPLVSSANQMQGMELVGPPSANQMTGSQPLGPHMKGNQIMSTESQPGTPTSQMQVTQAVGPPPTSKVTGNQPNQSSGPPASQMQGNEALGPPPTNQTGNLPMIQPAPPFTSQSQSLGLSISTQNVVKPLVHPSTQSTGSQPLQTNQNTPQFPPTSTTQFQSTNQKPPSMLQQHFGTAPIASQPNQNIAPTQLGPPPSNQIRGVKPVTQMQINQAFGPVSTNQMQGNQSIGSPPSLMQGNQALGHAVTNQMAANQSVGSPRIQMQGNQALGPALTNQMSANQPISSPRNQMQRNPVSGFPATNQMTGSLPPAQHLGQNQPLGSPKQNASQMPNQNVYYNKNAMNQNIPLIPVTQSQNNPPNVQKQEFPTTPSSTLYGKRYPQQKYETQNIMPGSPVAPNQTYGQSQYKPPIQSYQSYGQGYQNLNQGMQNMNLTPSGFNRMCGTENFDLLQCPNILPIEKMEPPKVCLGQEFLNAANCSPE